jgi:hypothetical protein
MGLRSGALLTAACASAVTLAVAAPAHAADVTRVGPGHLVAKGVTADVPVVLVCDAGRQFLSSGTLRQRANAGRIAEGFARTDLFAPCTGEPQTLTLRFDAAPVAFKSGTASLDYSLSDCSLDFKECSFENATRTLRLRSKGA